MSSRAFVKGLSRQDSFKADSVTWPAEQAPHGGEINILVQTATLSASPQRIMITAGTKSFSLGGEPEGLMRRRSGHHEGKTVK